MINSDRSGRGPANADGARRGCPEFEGDTAAPCQTLIAQIAAACCVLRRMHGTYPEMTGHATICTCLHAPACRLDWQVCNAIVTLSDVGGIVARAPLPAPVLQ